MELLRNARHIVRLGQGAEDRTAALVLRGAAFRHAGVSDEDVFDATFRPVLLSARATGALLASARVRVSPGAGILDGYAARFYDLAPVAGRFGRCIELGRLCTAPDADALALRDMLAGLAVLAQARRADLLFGCTSTPGTDPGLVTAMFSELTASQVVPAGWRPRAKAPEIVRAPIETDPPTHAHAAPPAPLLRLYLGLGAVVSDHAVVDRDLDTCHVFTALRVGGALPARIRCLLACAAPVEHGRSA